MYLEIETNSTMPLYLQLMTQIKKAIVKKQVTSGDSLPSVRSLASDLGVNMHTVNKAYNLMVEEGILVKNQMGYSIGDRPNADLSSEVIVSLKERLENLLIDTFVQGLSLKDTSEWVEEIARQLKIEEK